MALAWAVSSWCGALALYAESCLAAGRGDVDFALCDLIFDSLFEELFLKCKGNYLVDLFYEWRLSLYPDDDDSFWFCDAWAQ